MLLVAIVEDNPKSAALLQEYVESAEVKVSAIYASGEEALEAIPRHPLPDIALVDISLPGISGIEVIRVLKGRYPGMELIVQTVFEDTGTILDSIKAGASGYVLKASPGEEYVNALQEVKKGGSFLSGKIAKSVLQEFQQPRPGNDAQGRLERFGLTEREKEILQELIKGSAYKEIGERLTISTHTVGNHIRKIYQKLQVNSRGAAVARATDRNE